MTTATKNQINVQITRGEETIVGRQQTPVTVVTITADGFTWNAYVTASDEWWEGCGNCYMDSGYKPGYAGIYGGVCFQCGGVGIRRMAGGERAAVAVIRRRVSSRRGRLNAVQRREEREAAEAEAYCAAHPNLASDLARERAYGALGRNVLGEFALRIQQRPLSVRQEAYAVSLLVERAWEEAHAIEKPVLESVHAGEVGTHVTLTGTIVVWRYLPSEYVQRSDRVLLIIDARTPDGRQATLKTFTAAKWAMEAKKGQTVTVSGKVDTLEDGTYGKQTILVRPRLVEG